MGTEVNEMVKLFLSILHAFSIIEKKPWEFGTGSKIYLTEIQTVSMIGEHPDENMTQLADIMGVTRGAISQTVRKLVIKKLVVRTNTRNQKEINLGLTDFGRLVSEAYQARMKEVFTFADELYALATPAERELVKRLFLRIHSNMKSRIQ
ncbi:MAG: MarR family transcriptional regulator [Bacteroidia bacterium]|nr:MarR family transcriptional regulator [Bacteroidia bacterium]